MTEMIIIKLSLNESDEYKIKLGTIKNNKHIFLLSKKSF